jgi:hypothetical protein
MIGEKTRLHKHEDGKLEDAYVHMHNTLKTCKRNNEPR